MDHLVEIRTDSRLTTRDDAVATPEDARRLHAWPDAAPSSDEPVTVAIMDSGIHEGLVGEHPWFENVEVTYRADYTGSGEGGDAVGHGSGCASIVAKGAAEVMGDLTGDPVPVELEDHRIFGSAGSTDFRTIREAYRGLIDRADTVDVVNMSWGSSRDVPEINALHEKLVGEGVHDVVAAGNTGGEGGSPSTSPKAFSAGAVDQDGDLTRFTSRDPEQDNPDVAAVGKNVKMARAPGTSMGSPIDDQFTKASGTSFAAPWTAAAYAIALYRRRASWDRAFERAAPDIPGTKADGEGLLKLEPALGRGEPDDPPSADAATWDVSGDVLWMDWDRLPKNLDTTVELLDETEAHADIRVHKE